MAIRLEKGQRINLEKNNGAKLTQFCVGCNWGSIIKNGFLGLGNSVARELILLKSIRMLSSSPSPSPVRLSPVCSTASSGDFRLL